MPIATAFIKEMTRLATIVDVIIPRIVTKPVKLPNGDIMPPGTEWSVDIERMAQVIYCGINRRRGVSTERTTLLD